MLSKVDQTTYGVGKGNCFAACVASLLGLAIDDVPNFCCLYSDEEWYDEFIEWLKPRGYGASAQQFPGDSAPFYSWVRRSASTVPWIACGRTDRGLHCAVYVGDKLWHDPHPDREGLQDVEMAIHLLPDFVIAGG